MNSSGSSTWLIKCEVCILKITLLFFPSISQPSCFFCCSFFTFITSHALLFSSVSALPTLLSIIHHLTGDRLHFLQFSLFRIIPTWINPLCRNFSFLPSPAGLVAWYSPQIAHMDHAKQQAPLWVAACCTLHQLWKNHSSRVPRAYEGKQQDFCLCRSGASLLGSRENMPLTAALDHQKYAEQIVKHTPAVFSNHRSYCLHKEFPKHPSSMGDGQSTYQKLGLFYAG